MASAAAAKKCRRLSQRWGFVPPTSRRYASCTRAVACSVCPGASWAIFWVAIAFVWHTAPLGTFFLLAALQTIPPDLYRAARIDRAGLWSRLRHVTLPHIKYAVLIVLVVVTVEAFREFDTLFSMTLGGPGTATLTLPLLIFRYNFQFSKYGLAAAASVILIAISTVLSIVYFLLLRTRKRRVAQASVAAVALAAARA